MTRALAALVVAALAWPLTAQAASPPTPPGQFSALQVAIGDCLVAANPQRAAVPTTNRGFLDEIGGKLITAGVNFIGKVLTEAGAAKTWTATGVRNFEPDATIGLPYCVQVVRGKFDATGATKPTWPTPTGWPADLPQKLADRGLWAVEQPDFLFEGQIIQAKDRSAYTIRPVISTYANPIGTRAVRPGTTRHIALFFALTPPGVKATHDEAPASNVIIGKVATGTTFRYAAAPANLSSAYEPQWFSLSEDDRTKPLTVTAVLSETQEEQAFLAFLGKVLTSDDGANAKTVSTKLTQLLIPSAGQAAALEKAESETTLANDADTKLSEAISKLSACEAASGNAVLTAGAEAKGALRNFMIADLKLASPSNSVQEAMVNTIDVQQGATKVKAACAMLAAQLAKP